jgi:hypothetical protein
VLPTLRQAAGQEEAPARPEARLRGLAVQRVKALREMASRTGQTAIALGRLPAYGPFLFCESHILRARSFTCMPADSGFAPPAATARDSEATLRT